MRTPVNGAWVFSVLPSGSKAWWPHWESENSAREQFKAWLAEQPQLHHFIDWVEVVIQEDSELPRLVEHNHTEITDDGDEVYTRRKVKEVAG
jgi:hypothetical protein